MCEMGSLDSSPYMYWWSGSMRSDDCYKGGGGVADAVGSFGNISLFTYVNPNTGALDGTWYNSYQVIQRCNTAIQRMANFTEEELPNKNSFMGEMLFIRSFTLYRLKKLWKYVPYIDENVVGMSDAFEAVPNRELDKGNDLYLWQRILDDFKKAEELLPLDQMDKGRVSSNAATAMVARTILNMAYEQDDRHQVININKELLAEALPYIDKIIDQEVGRVGLESDFGNNFLVEYDNATKESIWELQFALDNNFHTAGRFNRAEGLNHPWMWPETQPGNFVFKCCDFNHASYTLTNAFKTDENGLPRFEDYNEDDYGQYIKNSDGSYNLDIVNSGAKPYFDKYTWDPRFSHTIVAPGQPWKYDPDLLFHSTATRDPITYSFLKPIKDMPHPDCGCIAYDGWQFNSMNKKMIRYDDVLLWKAEILIQLDREMEALPYINQIRTRAANSLFRLTQISSLDENIMNMKRSLALVRERLENLKVKAPIDGQVGNLEAQIGQSISAGEHIGQIITADLKVQALIDEHYVERVVQELPADFTRDGENYKLEVTKVYPEVKDGQFRTDFRFTAGRPGNIRAGQTYHINLQLGDPVKAVLIPRGGFFQITGGRWIYVVDESGKFAVRRPIKIGRQNPQFYEVTDGLASGEKVIISGYELFGDNEKLILNE